MDATTNKTANSEEREEVGGGRQQSNGRFVIVVSRGFPFRAEDQTCVAIRETHPRDQNSQNSRTSLKYLRSQRINFDKLHRVNVRARPLNLYQLQVTIRVSLSASALCLDVFGTRLIDASKSRRAPVFVHNHNLAHHNGGKTACCSGQ